MLETHLVKCESMIQIFQDVKMLVRFCLFLVIYNSIVELKKKQNYHLAKSYIGIFQVLRLTLIEDMKKTSD